MIVRDVNAPAVPTWDDLRPIEKADHRAECPDGCRFCDGHRAWGKCSSCGSWPKEADDHGESLCCGSYLILDPADGGPLEVREAA